MRIVIYFILYFISLPIFSQSFSESSTFNFKLGEYISIKDHPKAREVNLKIKAPVGWKVKEGDFPSIVMQFLNKGNTYMIGIEDNFTFYSRKQMRELLQEDDFVTDFVMTASSFLDNPKVLSQSIVTIGSYPAIQFKVKGEMEQIGITLPIITKCWMVFYEDKILTFQSMGPDFVEFELLYTLITNSIIFPDQYD